MQALTVLLCIWILPLFITVYNPFNNITKESWLVKNQSSLKVDGKTNINTFSCVVPTYEREKDMIVCEKTSKGCTVNSKLFIPVESFDCYHRIMTKDLQKTLKSHTYPYMMIDFKSFSKVPSQLNSGSNFTANADITLAGNIRNYTIQFTTKRSDADRIELIGKKVILFTEFGLTPPSKLGGTIKVKDELDVEFRLHLKKIE